MRRCSLQPLLLLLIVCCVSLLPQPMTHSWEMTLEVPGENDPNGKQWWCTGWYFNKANLFTLRLHTEMLLLLARPGYSLDDQHAYAELIQSYRALMPEITIREFFGFDRVLFPVGRFRYGKKDAVLHHNNWSDNRASSAHKIDRGDEDRGAEPQWCCASVCAWCCVGSVPPRRSVLVATSLASMCTWQRRRMQRWQANLSRSYPHRTPWRPRERPQAASWCAACAVCVWT